MKSVIINAQSREITGKKISRLRLTGLTPAILYGHHIKNVNLSVPLKEFEKIYKSAGESTLIDLLINGKENRKVIIQDVQRDHVKGGIIHIDFHEVKMTEKLNTDIPLKFIGESKAVKELGAILITNLSKIKAECLPGDLVHEIEVDISSLSDFDTSIHVKDINIPQGITVLDNPDEVIAVVTKPKVEEEVVAVVSDAEKAKVAEVAVVEKKKKEEVVEDKK